MLAEDLVEFEEVGRGQARIQHLARLMRPHESSPACNSSTRCSAKPEVALSFFQRARSSAVLRQEHSHEVHSS